MGEIKRGKNNKNNIEVKINIGKIKTENKNTEKKGKIENLEKENELLREENVKLQQKIEELEIERNKLEQEIKELKELLNELKNELNALKSELEGKKNSEQPQEEINNDAKKESNEPEQKREEVETKPENGKESEQTKGEVNNEIKKEPNELEEKNKEVESKPEDEKKSEQPQEQEEVKQEQPNQREVRRENKAKNIEKGKEKKEIDILELKAAEVLCYIDIRNSTPEEQKKAIERMRKEHGQDVIEKAKRVVEIRERGLEAHRNAIKYAKKKKESTLVEIAKENQMQGKAEYEFFERDNFYYPAIVDLKVALLKEKEEALKKEIENDPVLKKLSSKEKKEDIERKLIHYEAYELSRLVTTEIARMNELMESVYREEKLASAGILRKVKEGFYKLPRGLKAVIGSVVFGGAVAVLSPSIVITSVPIYFGYRAFRALTGATISGILQKFIGSKVVEKAFKKDVKKSFDKLGRAIEKGEELDESDIEIEKIPELIRAKKYEEVAKINLKIAEYQTKELKKHEKFRKINTFMMSLLTGIVGGMAGANIYDYIAGHHYGYVIDHGSKGSPSTPPENPPSGNKDISHTPEDNIPQKPNVTDVPGDQEIPKSLLALATVGKGEGVEHALIRQLKAHPEMFGYKGNLNDQAAIEEWAKHTAHKIAIENRYVDPITGEEIRVRDIGKPGAEDNPAYVLVNSSSGKTLVREFFNNQPTHGEGALNFYEYLWRPKFSENMLENQPSSTLDSASQSLTPVEEFRPVTPPPEMNIPDTLEKVPSFSKEELVDLMSKTFLPKMEYTLDNFKGLSLLEQEHILSQIQNDIAPHMNILKNYGDLLTPQDQEIMSNVNKLWVEMVHSYTENYNDFIETLMKRTSLNAKNLDSFLSLDVERALRDFTTSDGIFGKAVELLRRAKPTYEEIVNKVPVGHILKSRFAGDFNF